MERPQVRPSESAAEFALGGDDYQVVRYGAPGTKEEWVVLFEALLDCSPSDAELAYDAMFPGGYDPHGTEDVALVLVDEHGDAGCGLRTRDDGASADG